MIQEKAEQLIKKFGIDEALSKVEGMIRLATDFDYEEEVTFYIKLKDCINSLK